LTIIVISIHLCIIWKISNQERIWIYWEAKSISTSWLALVRMKHRNALGIWRMFWDIKAFPITSKCGAKNGLTTGQLGVQCYQNG